MDENTYGNEPADETSTSNGSFPGAETSAGGNEQPSETVPSQDREVSLDVNDEKTDVNDVVVEENPAEALLKRFILKAKDKGNTERAEALQAELDELQGN